MKIKGLNEYDICNYKKPSMFVIFPSCTFKCDKDCGRAVCQNSSLAKEPAIECDIDRIVSRYINNPLTHAIVCGGLEPFDSKAELFFLVSRLREKTEDDIVIYTGYKEEEITKEIESLKNFKNIIIKFGRFIPDNEGRDDEVLGVRLASDNQYARRIS